MNDYFFIYKDAANNWNSATNPIFIAKHSKCRAIEKIKLLKKFKSVREFTNKANTYPMSKKVKK